MPKAYISGKGWDKSLRSNRDLTPPEKVDNSLATQKYERERRAKEKKIKEEEREAERKRKEVNTKRIAQANKKKRVRKTKAKKHMQKLFLDNRKCVLELVGLGTPKDQILTVLCSKGMNRGEAGIVYKKYLKIVDIKSYTCVSMCNIFLCRGISVKTLNIHA